MKAHAPIYIAKQVWETCSSEVTHQASPSGGAWPGAAAVAVHTPDGTLHSQAQRPEELDPIQLMRTIMCALLTKLPQGVLASRRDSSSCYIRIRM